MSPRRAVALVAERELREGLRSRAWRASLAIQVVLVAGIAIVSIVTAGDSGPSERDVAVVGPRAERVAAKAREEQGGFGIELTLKRFSDPRAGSGRGQRR